MAAGTVRLLPTLVAAGPRQMALDEALLTAGAGAAVRLYRWEPETVSLGCFQDHDRVAAALPGPMPMVRRITGGGAIWHGAEVTYALAAPLGGPLPARTADLYGPLHGAIRAALAAAGARLDLQPQTVGDRRYADEPRCFASPAADDLVLERGKVLGSAARARDGRVLVHGSLKLASNPWDGDVVCGCGLDAERAGAALLAGLAAFLGATPEPAAWTTAELESAAAVERARYGDDGWVRRREGPRP
jgi:lipoate-protein ligase A